MTNICPFCGCHHEEITKTCADCSHLEHLIKDHEQGTTPDKGFQLSCISSLTFTTVQIPNMNTRLKELEASSGGNPTAAAFPLGSMMMMPFDSTELPVGWYLCDGTEYLKTSSAGIGLLSLSTSYVTNWNIATTSTGICTPNLVSSVAGAADEEDTVRSAFMRSITGTTRQVGSIEGDAIRNITGESGSIARSEFSGAVSTGALSQYMSVNGDGSDYSSFRTIGIEFDASLVVPTSFDNHPINYGMHWCIYLGTAPSTTPITYTCINCNGESMTTPECSLCGAPDVDVITPPATYTCINCGVESTTTPLCSECFESVVTPLPPLGEGDVELLGPLGKNLTTLERRAPSGGGTWSATGYVHVHVNNNYKKVNLPDTTTNGGAWSGVGQNVPSGGLLEFPLVFGSRTPAKRPAKWTWVKD